MRVFCDTSVLVAGSVKRHPHFSRAFPALEAIARGHDEGIASAHSVAEMFSALTSLPLAPRILPTEAERMVETNLLRSFRLEPITARMYQRAMEVCVRRGQGGGMIYDALLIECARSTTCDRILTLNMGDFRALAPDLDSQLHAP
jgi:predicted nucleic acid-binding protein